MNEVQINQARGLIKVAAESVALKLKLFAGNFQASGPAGLPHPVVRVGETSKKTITRPLVQRAAHMSHLTRLSFWRAFLAPGIAFCVSIQVRLCLICLI